MSTDGKEKDSEQKFSATLLEPIQAKVEIAQLHAENVALRHDVLALTAEVYGAKLAAKYLDKELAGRIQQLQLLGMEALFPLKAIVDTELFRKRNARRNQRQAVEPAGVGNLAAEAQNRS